MQHKWRFIWILLLCLIMCLPTMVTAEAITWEPTSNDVTSGTFGDDNLFTWKVSGNTLYITGDGYMSHDHWEDIKTPPWYAFRDTVEKVVFSENIKDVYSYCLKDFTNLKTVVWPEDIVIIWEHAFENCTSLVSLDIPDSVKEIYDYAFSGCTSLTTVDLPEKLRDLYSSAFEGCSQLSSIFLLPENLQMLGNSVFKGTALREIVVPKSVNMMGSSVFEDCSKLERAIIQSAFHIIERDMFRGCSSLKTVYFSTSIAEILDQAFAECDSLESLYFLGDMPAFAQQTDHNSSGFHATIYHSASNEAWSSDKIEALQSWLRGSELDFVSTTVRYCMDKHNEIIYAAVAPTCTLTGLTEGKYCPVCKSTLVVQETVPALGHSFGDWHVVTAATVESEGLAERICTVCNFVEEKLLDRLELPSTEPPTEPSAEPPSTEPSTEPTREPTQPTAEPTQPDIADSEKSDSFPWLLVVVPVATIAAAALGFLLSKKRK